MTFGQISPGEVYENVDRLRADVAFGMTLLYWLFALIVAQLIGKFLLYRAFVREARLTREFLKIAAQHGRITDAQRNRTEDLLDRAIKILDEIAAEAETTAHRAEELKTVLDRVEHQTNSMTTRMVEGAGREGVTEGREQMADEAKARGDVRGPDGGPKTPPAGPSMRDRIEEIKETTDEIRDAVKPDDE